MIAPFFALTENTPAPKRCWEVRANGVCSHVRNECENKNIPFDRNSPTELGDAVEWNILVLAVVCSCEHTPLARTSQHRFGPGVFLVSTKKGAIIYPEGFFQRPGKC